jgi:capping protein alpha
LNAPPGQFDSVLSDVKVITPDGLVTDDQVEQIARDFNTRNLRILREGDHPPVILSKLGEVGGATNKYLEPKSNQVFTVNHSKFTLNGEPMPADGVMDADAEGSRKAVQGAVEEYVNDRFVEGTAASAVYAAPQQLSIVISGEKLNLRNFWSGQFLSTWTVQLAPTGPTVSGEIKIRAHYFEEGNVQLNTKKVIAPVTLTCDEAGLAEAIKNLIFTEEKVIQEGLEEMYANMTEETFKAMRRVMPVHRNKVNWNINEVKLNANLRK